MTERTFLALRRTLVAFLLVLSLSMVIVDIERVVVRLGFDYDLLLWGDDYFMTSMAKLAAGLSVYTAVSDANSTVYPPGGPWLHHALLAPFGLDASLLANRILNQAWLVLAVTLGTMAVIELARAAGSLPASRPARGVFGAVAASVLALTAYANPVADSLHPTNLELVTLAATELALASWLRLSVRARVFASLTLPVLALLAKQTAGVAVTGALAAALVLTSRGSAARRALAAAVPILALALALTLLTTGTHGLFKTWAFDVLSRHPFDWRKPSELSAGYVLLFAPCLVTVVASAVMERARLGHSDFHRALLLPLAYAPLALAALFKTMGGPNNLAVLGFLLVLAALPIWQGSLFGAHEARRWTVVVVGAVAAAQLGLLYPRRRVPNALDRENARIICEYASRRMRCGERVHLGRGSVCYARGGVAVPLDRLSSIVEVTVAGRAAELGFPGRVRDTEYDVLILPMNDLLWYGGDFWRELRARYVPFFSTRGELENDFWFDGWQGYVSWPMVFFERLADHGRHRVDPRNIASDPCGESQPGDANEAVR
jgi:hypothetical protein